MRLHEKNQTLDLNSLVLWHSSKLTFVTLCLASPLCCVLGSEARASARIINDISGFPTVGDHDADSDNAITHCSPQQSLKEEAQQGDSVTALQRVWRLVSSRGPSVLAPLGSNVQAESGS